MRNALLLSLGVTTLCAGAAPAALLVPRNGETWAATYEGDVAPPTGSTPAWTQFDVQGSGAAQSTDGNLYTVNTAATTDAVSYFVTGGWSGTGPTRTVEIRTRVIPESYEATDGAAGLVIGVNDIAFNLRFHTGYVTFNIGGSLNTAATLDTTQFHTYRMVADLAGSPNFRLYIDGNPSPVYTANSAWFNSSGFDSLVWGDFSAGGLSGHTETDFISWGPGALTNVPEPASLTALALGAFFLRRKSR